MLGVGIQTWYRHMKFCVKNEVENALAPDVGDVAAKIIDKVDELIGQMDRIKGNINRVNNAIEMDNENIDVQKMKSYVSLEKQLGSTIELLAKISGELNSSAVINVNNTKIEYNSFRENVIGTVCNSCKQKLLELK